MNMTDACSSRDSHAIQMSRVALTRRRHLLLHHLHRCRRRMVLLLHVQELTQVFRKEEVKRPVERDAHLLLHTRKLRQIDRSPHPPRDEPGKVKAKDISHARTMPDRRELPDGLELELPKLAPDRPCLDVVSEHASLP